MEESRSHLSLLTTRDGLAIGHTGHLPSGPMVIWGLAGEREKSIYLSVCFLGLGLLALPFTFSGKHNHILYNDLQIFTTLALGSLIIIARCGSERNCKTYQEVDKQ